MKVEISMERSGGRSSASADFALLTKILSLAKTISSDLTNVKFLSFFNFIKTVRTQAPKNREISETE